MQRKQDLLDISAEHVHGGTQVIEADPPVLELRDVVYVPCTPGLYFHTDSAWGIYRDGQLVPEAAYLRGPGDGLVGQSWSSPVRPTQTAEDDTYIYVGTMQEGFGHFLLSSLDRLWMMDRSAKFLIHGYSSPQTWFTLYPFVAEALSTLGIVASDFVLLDKPCRIRRLIVPGSSFRETHSAHMVYGRLGACIGSRLLAGQTLAPGPPVYLSKERLAYAIWKIVNEEVLTDRLARAGVEIVFPETLPLERQLELFQTRRIIGTLSSALHLCALAPRPCDMIVLTREPMLMSSFPLLDRVKRNRARYLAPEPPMEYLGSTEKVSLNCRLVDPVAVAEALLRALDKPSELPVYLI